MASPRLLSVENEATDSHSSPRLTLHIPNSYPRSLTSPRSASPSSPRSRLAKGTLPYIRSAPDLTQQEAHGRTEPASPSLTHSRIRAMAVWIRQYAKSQKTSGESARDFLARERTFFSWLRLSTMLAVASAALFFRLQIKDLSKIFKLHEADHSFDGLQAALQRRAARRQLVPSRSIPLQHAFEYIPGTATPSPTKHVPKSILDTNILLSRSLGVAFLIISLACLTVGYVDYIRCERALECADKLVPITSRHGDDEHPVNVERRELARKWHDGRMARSAHSSFVVHVTEVTTAALIFATALIILITSEKASIAPVSPAI